MTEQPPISDKSSEIHISPPESYLDEDVSLTLKNCADALPRLVDQAAQGNLQAFSDERQKIIAALQQPLSSDLIDNDAKNIFRRLEQFLSDLTAEELLENIDYQQTIITFETILRRTRSELA